MPAVITVIEAVVSPVLHAIVPPTGIDKVDVPQLSTTVTIGAGAVVLAMLKFTVPIAQLLASSTSTT